MKARLEAAKIQATPGQPFVVEVDITNTASVIDAFSARLTGLDPDWVTASATGLQIFPNEHRTIELTVELPSDFPSGLHRLGVVVQSALDQALDSRLPIEIEVTESGAYTARLEPPLLNGACQGFIRLTSRKPRQRSQAHYCPSLGRKRIMPGGNVRALA